MGTARALWWGTISLALVLVVGASNAEEKALAKPLDVSFISDEYIAALVVHPGRLLKSPALKELPLDEVATAIQTGFGVDPRQIEQAIVLLPVGPRPVPVAVILRFSTPHGGEKALAQMAAALRYGELAPAEHAGKRYWRCIGRVAAAGYAADAHTLLVGSELCVQTMMATKAAQSPLLDRLRKVDARNDLALVAVAEPVSRLLEKARDLLYAQRSDAAPIADFGLSVLKRCKTCVLAASTRPLRLTCELDASDAEGAEFLHDLLRGGAAFAKTYLPVLWRKLKNDGISANSRLAGYIERLTEPPLRGVTVRRVDARVIVAVEVPDDFITLAISLLDLVDDARSQKNMRQMALAVHSYHDVHMRLPAHANYDKNGRPLLSWRVHLLPYMEGLRLYERFKLDEPWDSEHNKKLIPLMPKLFESPGRKLPPGKTCYLVPTTGDMKYQTIFPKGTGKKGEANDGMLRTFGNVTDGSAFTLMLVEAAPERAVIWTKPDDWEFDVKKPREGLFGMRPRHPLVSAVDASQHRLRKDIPDDVLRAVFGCSDGDRHNFRNYTVEENEERP
jgi:hypothetical protein